MDTWWKTHKEQIRQQAKNTLAQLSSLEKKQQSDAICEQLDKYIDQYHSRAVFVPFSYEPNIQSFIQQLWGKNKVVLLPQIHNDTMQLAIYTPDSRISQGQYGEAIIQDVVLYEWALDVCLVPWLAFDRQWWRVGHGKWYYDRFLEANDCYRIGICYEQTKLSSIIHDIWDQKMDRVIL